MAFEPIDNEIAGPTPSFLPLGATQEEPKKTAVGTLTGPLREGVAGLKTLYGGGEQGIANKLKTNVVEAAKDIEQGNVVKGVVKAGLRTAGDVAGTIYAPVATALGATGIQKAFDYVGEKFVESKLGQKITDSKTVQQFATEHPNAGEDFGRALNLAFAKSEKGTINPKTAIPRTVSQVSTGLQTAKTKIGQATPDIFKKDVATMRAEKIKSGLEEQNVRLKSAQRSFDKNTITRKENGKVEKITPIDTMARHNVAPTIEKGTILMGDYNQGTGALGKIKEIVGTLDDQIDDVITNNGKGVNVKTFENLVLKRILEDADLKRAGVIDATVAKVKRVFKDYRKTYGEILPETEINGIRKIMNRDFNLETKDASRIIADAAREIVYNVTKDQKVRALLREQGELLAARKYAETINGTKVTGGRVGNYVMRTIGTLIGASTNIPIAGGVLGALGGELAARGLQQSQFKSLGAETKALFQKRGPSSESNKNQATSNPKATSNMKTINTKLPQNELKVKK